LHGIDPRFGPREYRFKVSIFGALLAAAQAG
jgi:hypothetical protein